MSSDSSVISDLARWGPGNLSGEPPTLAASRGYCRGLARSHYENFTVGSLLMPKRLREHFYNIYAYCRWADDLGDETGNPAESLRLLDWWQDELDACYRGKLRHPVFVALRDTIDTFGIPADPLARLITAFRQDQQPTRFETFNSLVGYCRNSADPVGELVLYLGDCHTPEHVDLSNRICTGLQLANFWQDVARDWAGGRLYLPGESLAKFGYTAPMLESRTYNDAFRGLMHFEVERAETWLLSGRSLVRSVPRKLRLSIAMYLRGGLAILEEVRRLDYNVWHRRPTLSRLSKMRIAVAAWRESRKNDDRSMINDE